MSLVVLTKTAKDYLDSVRPDDGHVTLTVDGGGCAGFTYKWGTTDEWTGQDIDIEWIEVENMLLVDPVCEMNLLGSNIYYNTTIEGAFLNIINPMASSNCGCGSSFGV